MRTIAHVTWVCSGLALAAAVPLVGCGQATSDTNLSRDYVLASTDPGVGNVNNILMRYEDDWLPGTCVGRTRHLPNTLIRIEWKCRYLTNAGPTLDAPIEGSLADPDGDGTFSGTLVVAPLPDINSKVLGPVAAFEFTMTPYVPTDAGL